MKREQFMKLYKEWEIEKNYLVSSNQQEHIIEFDVWLDETGAWLTDDEYFKAFGEKKDLELPTEEMGGC